jgi:hypothetical protein
MERNMAINKPAQTDYCEWNEISTLSDCFRLLDKKHLANAALNNELNFADSLKILEKEARMSNRQDVLEVMHFAGLIYA